MRAAPLILTGATGFVGRRLVARLQAQGRPIRALVRDPARLQGWPGVEAVAWAPGATDPGLLEGAAAVCHLAAFIPQDLQDPEQAEACLRINALGTLDLLRAARSAGVARFVFMSTGNLYARAPGPIPEDWPIWPITAPFYLSSKALADLYVAQADAAGWIQGVRLRPSAIYGPGMKGGVMRTFADRLRAGLPIVLQDGGRHRVDFVAVDDVVQGTVAALERPVAGAFNLGSGQSTSILTLARALAEQLAVPPEQIEVRPPVDAPPSGYPALDIRRAQALLGYSPRPLREGLASWMAP